VEDSETPVVEDKILGKFDDVDSLAKSYQELQSRMGNSVRIPNADSSAEEVSSFYQKMGMPESPEGYTVGEGMEEMLAGFKPMAHSANLTQRQFDHFAKAQGEAADAAEASLKASEDRLKGKWGDNYDMAHGVAAGAVEALSEHSKILEEALSGVDLRDEGSHELFTTIGQLLMDGSAPTQGQGDSMAGETDDMAIAIRVREIMKMKAFSDIRDPEHEKIKVEYYEKITDLVNRGYEGVSDARLKPNPFKGVGLE